MGNLAGKRILLGVTGGIAAYKAVDLVRRLTEAGAEVRVVMTPAATRFVGGATFQAVSGHPVRDSLWDEAAEAAMGHIELARWADAVLVAPASADFMARLTAGMADDLLATLCLATECPLILVPAMNRAMWANPATRANAALLQQRGIRLLGPDNGAQACGEIGPGRMLEPVDILAALDLRAGSGELSGRRVIVTAGPTREPIDPVRYITNRSSGRMGYAVASAAVRSGADVVLVSGPAEIPAPYGMELVRVETAQQMLEAVHSRVGEADIFIAAAAVADYRPAEVADQKIKKKADNLSLDMVRAPDVLASVSALSRPPFLVGFAAETHDLETHARIKLESKNLDLIAANTVGPDKGFDRDDNALVCLWPGGREDLGHGSKATLADRLIALIAERMNAAPAEERQAHAGH
jgi:phosphopantothenoylcysteine decarboxylase/phosphopantothenate--cysteine ligase